MQELTVGKSSTQETPCPILIGETIPPVPTMLQQALESVWVDTVRKAQGIPQEGFAGMEKEFWEKILKLAANLLGEALTCALGTGYGGYQIVCPGCGGLGKERRQSFNYVWPCSTIAGTICGLVAVGTHESTYKSSPHPGNAVLNSKIK